MPTKHRFLPAHGFRSVLSIPAMLLCLCGLLFGLPGCSSVDVATQAAGPGLEIVSELIKMGKFQAYEPIPMEKAVATVRQAAAELKLQLVTDKIAKEGFLHLGYTDQRKQTIDVYIVPRTPAVTAILIDVGAFGKSGMGRVLVRQILFDLPPLPPSSTALPHDEDPTGRAMD